MAQEFQVMRCFLCHTFQVHQVKKSKKWACKLCGEKQSVLKVYGQGSGADCRRHVQKLNLLQGEVEQVANSSAVLNWQTEPQENKFKNDSQSSGPSQLQSTSCWSKYLEEERERECVKQEEDDSMVYADQSIAPASQTRKRRKVLACGSDQKVCGGFLNVLKKNGEWNVIAREVQPTFIKTENASSMRQHGRTVSWVAEGYSSPHCNWEKFMTHEEESKVNPSSIHGHQIMSPKTNAALNHDKKTGLAMMFAGVQSAETRTSLSHKGEKCGPVKEEELDRIPKPSSPQNMYCSIFQTDEDFEDDF